MISYKTIPVAVFAPIIVFNDISAKLPTVSDNEIIPELNWVGIFALAMNPFFK